MLQQHTVCSVNKVTTFNLHSYIWFLAEDLSFFGEMGKMDDYVPAVEPQGALVRLSEESNVGGLLSFGCREVWLYSLSEGLGLAGEKRSEWAG